MQSSIEQRQTLPPAIKGDKHALSPAAKAEIAALNGARPLAFTFQLIWAWTVIVGAISWAQYMGTPWAAAIAILLVATRQNVLGLLVHEQTHLLGYRGRFGDVIVNCLAGYPLLLLTVENYAQVHLAHHRDYFGKEDPDFRRKSGPDWTFPKRPMELAKLFMGDLLGINTIKVMKGKKSAAENPVFVRRHKTPKWVRPLYFVGVAAVLSVTGTWLLFLLYWVLPILTVTQVIVRWGAICEHRYNVVASVADSTPLILLSWWEVLLLPNLNFAMHPYHHYYPGVSFSHLPRIHAIYQREGLINEENVFHGYRAYLAYLTTTVVSDAAAPSVDGASSAS